MKIFETLQNFNDRMAAAAKERQEKEAELKKRVGEREAEIESLKKDFERIAKQDEENRKAYQEILKEKENEISSLMKARDDLKLAHEKGKIGLNEYMAQRQTDSEIIEKVNAKFTERIEIARMAAADVARERLRILADIEKQNSWIGVAVREFWKKFIDLLDKEKRIHEKYASFAYGPGNKIRTDYSIATGNVTEAAIFEPKSWNELNAIVISGMIQPKHFDQFDKMIIDLRGRGLDFDRHKLTISYRAGIHYAFKAGFDYNLFDKSSQQVIRM
jgi:hypothetical protein